MSKELFLCVAGFFALLGLSYGIEQFGDLSDPLKSLYIWSGWLSFSALILGLFAGAWGRFLGLCALVLGLWHLSLFVIFDFYFEWGLMWKEILQKHYLYYGIAALVLMIILGICSFLGTFWRFLLWLVLCCAIFSLVHIVMIQKVLSAFYWLVVLCASAALGYKAFCKLRNLRNEFFKF